MPEVDFLLILGLNAWFPFLNELGHRNMFLACFDIIDYHTYSTSFKIGSFLEGPIDLVWRQSLSCFLYYNKK